MLVDYVDRRAQLSSANAIHSDGSLKALTCEYHRSNCRISHSTPLSVPGDVVDPNLRVYTEALSYVMVARPRLCNRTRVRPTSQLLPRRGFHLPHRLLHMFARRTARIGDVQLRPACRIGILVL